MQAAKINEIKHKDIEYIRVPDKKLLINSIKLDGSEDKNVSQSTVIKAPTKAIIKFTPPNNAKKLALHLLGKSFKYCEIESLNFINELQHIKQKIKRRGKYKPEGLYKLTTHNEKR